MNSQLRKAAILVKSLDKPSAEALLAQMPAGAAKRVLAAAEELTAIDPDEQKKVMRDFLARKPGHPVDESAATSVDVQLSLSQSASTSIKETEAKPAPAPVLFGARKGDARFAYITAEWIEPLASLLGREQPQLAALILAHLPADRSAAVLALLDSSVRAAIVQRIAGLDDTDADILDEIERELNTRLMRERLNVNGSAQGLAALSGILQASDPDLRKQISSAIGSRNAAKVLPLPLGQSSDTDAEQQQKVEYNPRVSDDDKPMVNEKTAPAIEFTSLSELDDISLAAVFGAVSPQVAILALVGAQEPLVGRILRLLPRKEAAGFRKKLDEVGPLRLKEVELAQNQMSQAAGALLFDRRITLPVPQRVRLAA